MKSKSSSSGKSYSDMNCIWMTSELVKYKLCDKEFDCENCEFDRVFRNLSAKIDDKSFISDNPNSDIVERLLKRIASLKFDNKLIYLKNQLVMKNLFGNAYYLGINPVLLYLLDDFKTVHEFHSNDIKKDQIIFTFEGNWGIKQFVSPINFMIIEKVNSFQFKTNQWYAIVLYTPTDDESFIVKQDEWEMQKSDTLSYLENVLLKRPAIGHTMMDGGEKVNYLHQYIGAKEYCRLVDKVFR